MVNVLDGPTGDGTYRIGMFCWTRRSNPRPGCLYRALGNVPALECVVGPLVEKQKGPARSAPRLETGVAEGAVVGVRHPLH